MTFLNGLLAFGAAAFVVPLVIHLLNRSRFRTIRWGAMHLLESVIRVNNRRIQFEQLILLLVRCAIPVLLAVCLARPVLTGWQALPGAVPSSTVILLDNSYSMDAASDDRPRFSEAIESACDILASLHKGSEVSVVTIGGGSAPVFDRPVFDPKTMIQQVQLLPGGYGAVDVVDALESGMAILSGMANARRDLVVISDFQCSDWESLPPATLERIRQQLDALPVPPTVTLLHVGDSTDENVAIDSLEFSSKALGVGQDLQLRANLRNYGSKVYPSARVLLRVDGTQHAVSQIALPAHATAQTLFTHRFKTPGSHVLQVEVAIDDELETDNRYAAAVDVLEQIEVLLVDGAPSSRPLESETDFLSVALTPFTFGRVKLSDLIVTRTVPIEKLSQDALTTARVLVLANVARLSDSQVTLLKEYARGGGSVLVFVGNKIDLEWYNRTLADPAAGFLPMRLAELAGQDVGPTGRPSRIVAQHFEHPALQVFNDRANGNLADAEIQKWYRFGDLGKTGEGGPNRGPSPAAGSSAPLVLARLETGDPLIVEWRFGEGLVVQIATACDADWSNLPMRPVFLPLMQQLVTHMAARVRPPCNIGTGEPLVALLPGDLEGAALSLATPNGTRHTVRPAARGTHSVVQFGATRQPGVYTLTGPDGRPRHFVAETARSESNLRLSDAEHLDALAAGLRGDLVRSSAEYVELDRTRRHGREVWRWVFLAVLGLMFVELILQQQFSRVRR